MARIILCAVGLLFMFGCEVRPASRVAVLVGGSGEDSANNAFVQELKGLGQVLANRGWQVRPLIRTHNPQISQGIESALASAAPGSEVLVLFHTHGREREDLWAQRTHSVVSESPDFDLDVLEKPFQAASARGVRTALVDLSCYSGATQAMKGPGCLVTLAATQYISLCSGRPEERLFTSRFFRLPPKGQEVQLEEQFLAARREDHESINLPQISSMKTPAVDAWGDFLKTVDPLDVYEDLQELRPSPPPFPARRLLSELDRAGASAQPSERAEVQSHLKRVLDLRAELERSRAVLARDYETPRIDIDLGDRRALSLAPGRLGELLEWVEGGVSPRMMEETHAQRNLMERLKPLVLGIHLNHDRELNRFRLHRDDFDRLQSQLEAATGRLFESERQLFDSMQKSLPKGDIASRECREFAL